MTVASLIVLFELSFQIHAYVFNIRRSATTHNQYFFHKNERRRLLPSSTELFQSDLKFLSVTEQFNNRHLLMLLAKVNDDDENLSAKIDETTRATSNKVSKKEGKERSGFLTALILGPPLLAKFGIVLMVKFLTDLVVFPLLFLYRICRLMKRKISGIFHRDEGTVNGA